MRINIQTLRPLQRKENRRKFPDSAAYFLPSPKLKTSKRIFTCSSLFNGLASFGGVKTGSSEVNSSSKLLTSSACLYKETSTHYVFWHYLKCFRLCSEACQVINDCKTTLRTNKSFQLANTARNISQNVKKDNNYDRINKPVTAKAFQATNMDSVKLIFLHYSKRRITEKQWKQSKHFLEGWN